MFRVLRVSGVKWAWEITANEKTDRFLDPVDEVVEVWIVSVARYALGLQHFCHFSFHFGREYKTQDGTDHLQDENHPESVGKLQAKI